MENDILKIARRIQAISQTGLHYAQDVFDKQRYEELRDLSVQLAYLVTDAKINQIRDLFTNETGFQTPKIDIRTVVLCDGKILLTRERTDGKWSLPGGYADINYSPSAVAEKEVFEETGLRVTANRILAVLDTDKHNFPPMEYHFYKIVILCDLLGGELRDSEETEAAGFFDFDNLPELSQQRNNRDMIDLVRRQISTVTTYTD